MNGQRTMTQRQIDQAAIISSAALTVDQVANELGLTVGAVAANKAAIIERRRFLQNVHALGQRPAA